MKINRKLNNRIIITLFGILFTCLVVSEAQGNSGGPQIERFTPPQGEVNIATNSANSSITVTFDENVSNIDNTTFKLYDKNDTSIGTQTVNYNSSNFTATLTTSVSLSNASSPYTVKVFGGSSGVKNAAGTLYRPSDFTWQFWVGNANGTSSSFNVPHNEYTTSTSKCGQCHQIHRGQAQRLLKKNSTVGMCYTCHDGTASTYNINSVLPLNGAAPTSYHPIKNIGYGSNKVNCTDCHNPHNANNSRNVAANYVTAFSGALSYSKGIIPPARAAWTAIGAGSWTTINDPTYQYQLCFKCHSTYSPPDPTIKSIKRDISMETNTANKSFHPIEGNSPNTSGTFVNGYSATARVQCTDCHASPAGAKGPHASTNLTLLKAPYNTNTGTSNNSHLCFLCHNYNNYATAVQNAASGYYLTSRNWNGHGYHVNKIGYIRCQWCHSAVLHGSNYNNRLIITTATPTPYRTTVAKMSAFTASSGNYSTSNCTTADGTICYKH